jgi:hypothetical protein
MDHDNTSKEQRSDSAETPAGAHRVAEQQLTIAQTATGYWSVQRGGKHVAGAMTQRAAEAERDLMVRLHRRNVRRTGVHAAGV